MLKNTKAIIENYLDNTFNNVALRVGKADEIIGEIYLSTNGEINEKTIFDMASVTKILATSTLTHIAFSDGLLSPQTLVSDFFNVPPDKRGLKIHHLLTHTIGFGHINLTAPQNNYQNIAEYILNIEGIGFGKEVIYSCPAFILLGKILEKVYNKPLDVLFLEKVAKPLNMNKTVFKPLDFGFRNIINHNLNENECGIVNDYNCRYLGGIAGNAGVFSCVSDLTEFLKMLYNHGAPLYDNETFDMLRKNYTENMSEDRALGFVYVTDRFKQTGGLFKNGAIGHCGHTGQSIFIDVDSGLYVILLTDATKTLTQKYNYEPNYQLVMDMRQNIHEAISEDLKNG